MSFVDLGKMVPEKNKIKRRFPLDNHDRPRAVPKNGGLKSKIFFLGVLSVIVFLGVKILSTPSQEVMATFLSGSGSVISYMLPGAKEIVSENGVTNFMLVGIDRRSSIPYSYQGLSGEIQKNGFLADTIIVASVNHENEEVKMLSIPRDLWVQIPSFGELQAQYSKINASHSLGDSLSGEDNGGMLLLEKVVEDVLQIPIHYWLRIDFAGFEKGVDALGGLDILVERSFTDYMYPRSGYENASWEERWETASFTEGLQHMSGEIALKYARSRHALGPEGTDFARARRQQKVIIAAKNKVLSSPDLLSPAKIREMYDIVADNVRTNVQMSDISPFLTLASKLTTAEVKMLSLTDEGLNLLTTPQDLSPFGGAWVLIPSSGYNNYSAISDFVLGSFYEESED